MTVGPETLRLAAERRIALTAITDESTRALVRAHVRAWDQVAQELQDALEVAAARLQAGDRLTWRQLNDVDRFGAAINRLADQLDDLAAAGRVSITNSAGDAVTVAEEFQPRTIASQFPSVGPPTAELAQRFSRRVAGGAFDAIVQRAQDRIVSRMAPLSAEAQAAMRRALVRGIAVGDNPRTTARRMLRQVETSFNGGLTRALRVARTEQLDAYRDSAMLVDQANADVVSGWQWHAELGPRTCPSCLAMHGQQFPSDVSGPDDHVQGRCDRLPVVKPWSELGFNLPEPPSQLPGARAWFTSQPQATQLAVMGPSRLEAFTSGRIGWNDMTRQIQNPDWRTSRQVPSLTSLGIDAEAVA